MSRLTHPATSARPQRADWVAAAVCLVLQMIAPRSGAPAEETLDPAIGLLSLLLAVGQAVPVVWRRSRPVPVAVVVLACYVAYAAIVGVVPPFAGWLAIWSLTSEIAARNRAVAATGYAAVATVVGMAVAAAVHREVGLVGVLAPVTVIVALAAVLVRSERDRVEAARRYAAAEERLRIAADVHDVVGHGLSAVAVQSGTARLALESGDLAAARTAIAAIETTSRASMRDVRQWLQMLRNSATTPAPGLVDVSALAANARSAGVVVNEALAADPALVSPAVQLCAYRVVQESLTNALKHAPGAIAAISTSTTDECLQVTVMTSGASQPPARQDSGGFGLDGLRARVAAVGGQFAAGPTADGWAVEAKLPVDTVPS